jgi:hypothetical protein
MAISVKNFLNEKYFVKITNTKLDYPQGEVCFDVGLFNNINDAHPYRSMRFFLINKKKHTLKVSHLDVKNLGSISVTDGMVIHLSTEFEASNEFEKELLRYKNRFIELKDQKWSEVYHNESVYIENDGLYTKNSEQKWVKSEDYAKFNVFDNYFSIDEMNKSGSNIIKSAYEYLKSLPEFAGAEDC